MTNFENAKNNRHTVESADANGFKLTVEEWLNIRKEAGKTIDPDTAEVMWDGAAEADLIAP